MTTKRRLAAVPERPQRVVPYIRVSALMGRGGDDFHSPEVQLGGIRRLTVGMHEVEIIRDIDETGTTFERAGIDRLRTLARHRAIDVVAVYNIKRFGRNTLEGLQTLNELADYGVTIMSAKEHIDTSTPAGRKHLTDLLSLAQMQAEEIGEVWSDVIRQRAANGLQHGYPTGYRRVKGGAEIDPIFGPVMAECFRRYAAGISVRKIVAYYHAATGRTCHPRNMRARLRNPTYTGRVHNNGEVLPGAHEPLVDEETWQRCQERIRCDGATPPRHIDPTWSLAGLISCPTCEKKLQRVHHKTKKGVREDRVVCGGSTALLAAGGCPGIGSPRLALVEQAVLDKVVKRIEHLKSDHLRRVEALARKANARADVVAMEAELGRLERAQAKLAKDWALVDVADDAAYRAAMGELRATAETLRGELKTARADVIAPDTAKLVGAAEALLALWGEAEPAERRTALRAVLNSATMRRASYWREPEGDRIRVDWVGG